MELSKIYDPKNVESKWYKVWQEQKLFKPNNNYIDTFTIMIPPPNVTGILHMGHVLNNTIQDILIRKQRMNSNSTLWLPGMDHASIATEAKVTKMLLEQGQDKEKIGRTEFLKHAWDWKEEYGGKILNQLKRLGASCDWDETTFTMDSEYSEAVIHAFVQLYKDGLIYRGERIINWDPKGLTALSDEEVIYKEKQGHLWHFKYPIKNSDRFIVVATTRPETMLGDTGVAVNPNDKRYKDLIGQTIILPIVNREIPIFADEYVDMEFGTGCVKVTPAHDPNDYEMGVRHQLQLINIFHPDAKLNENCPEEFQNLDRFEARKLIIKKLTKQNLIDKIEDYTHQVGHSERTDAVVEPYISKQWFLKMDNLAAPALNVVKEGKIKFYPERWTKTYNHWLENIKDWCISRQLWWGHRIPVWYKGDEIYCGIKAPEGSGWTQEEDVLDTWFSSWLWPFATLGWPKETDELKRFYPTNDLVTGHDILFFWVARMIIAGYEFQDKPPFKHVYFTGMVRDQKRRKMSKSLGNSPDPIQLINKYGADGVRSGMLFASPAGNDLLFDESLCEQGRNFSNKIWNAFRLINSWESKNITQSNMNKEVVLWFQNKISKDIQKMNKFFTEFRISDALMVMYKLFWNDFCGSYLEIIKPVDKVIDLNTQEKTLYFFENILISLHPFMPFITEDIWQKIKIRNDGASISFTTWPNQLIDQIDEKKIENFNHLFKLIGAIRNIRKDKNISFKEKISLFVDNNKVLYFKEILQKTCNLDQVDVFTNQHVDVFPFLVDKNRYFIPLTFYVNPSIEIKRIEQEISYLDGFLQSINNKLSNEKFIGNAPKNIILIEEKKKEDTIVKLASLKKQLNAFDGSKNIHSK